MLRNMKTGTRLSLGFSVIIVLMFAIIFISLVSMKNIQEKIELIVKLNNVRIRLTGTMIDTSRESAIHVRNILLGHGRSDFRSYLDKEKIDILEGRKIYSESIIKLEEMTPSEDVRGLNLISKAKSAGDSAVDLQDRVISLAYSGRFSEASSVMINETNPSVDEWLTSLNSLIKYNEERNELRYNQMAESQQDAQEYMITVGIIAILSAVGLAFFLTLGITRPLSTAIKVADRISSGDLTADIKHEERGDEVGVLMNALKKMSDNLRDQTREIFEMINLLASSTSQVSATSKQLVASAQETSTSVSETTTTMEEVKQTSRLVSQKANLVSDISQNTAQVSETGMKSSEEFFAVMGKIREQMDFIANSIVKLSEQSQTIGLIISAVNDLASQSNLLAVNASIEASKAGEHGKGFAVVAQEVRSLAEQSKDATNQVRTILSDIQKSITGAVMATEQGKNAVDAGVKQSHEARDAIRQMSDGIIKSSQASMQIVVSINEQVIGIDQVAFAMESIKKATEQIVESTRQSESLSRNLGDMGARMKQMTEKFSV